MECQTHNQKLTQVCLNSQCDYMLLCLQCQEQHDQHYMFDLYKILDQEVLQRSFELVSLNADEQLKNCDESFKKVVKLIENLLPEIQFQIDNNPLISLFKTNSFNSQFQNKFSQICKELQLELTIDFNQEAQFQFKNSTTHWLHDSFIQLCNSVSQFHCELYLDVNKIVQKVTEFINLVDEQFNFLSTFILKEKMKFTSGIQNLSNFNFIKNCELCPPQSSLQDELVYDPIAYIAMHQQCYLFNNCLRDTKNICSICKGNNASVQCSDCELKIHYYCALEQKPSTMIIDKFEHKITCLNHVDQFYTVNLKKEYQPQQWDLEQLESKSQSNSQINSNIENDQSDVADYYNNQLEFTGLDQQNHQFQQQQQSQQQLQKQRTSFFKLKNAQARIMKWGLGQQGFHRTNQEIEINGIPTYRFRGMDRRRFRGRSVGRPRGSRLRRKSIQIFQSNI